MARYELDVAERLKSADGEGPVITKAAFDRFSVSLLGLGDLTTKPREVHAICTMFDLAGYTNFSNHVDPHLAVPEFLRTFLLWLFDKQRSQMVAAEQKAAVELYADLPFFAKFMGDGVLFLWPSSDDEIANCNVLVDALHTCNDYRTEFLPKVRTTVVDPPETLRCGIARGRVWTVGNGEDYIGPCINLAARLQKLGPLRIAAHRHGFDLDNHMKEDRRQDFVLKRTELRGIGKNELVWVLKEELENTSGTDRALFRDA